MTLSHEVYYIYTLTFCQEQFSIKYIKFLMFLYINTLTIINKKDIIVKI